MRNERLTARIKTFLQGKRGIRVDADMNTHNPNFAVEGPAGRIEVQTAGDITQLPTIHATGTILGPNGEKTEASYTINR